VYNGQYDDQLRGLLTKVVTIMQKGKSTMLPSLQRLLTELGENIRLARLRRKFSTTMVAQRAGIARNTLRAIERGDARVAFGNYVNVLLCLGLEKDLKLIAQDDQLGRKLQDANLSIKARAPRLKHKKVREKKKTHE
jgi:transcriptional regulator with XRE-family HTH domain